MIGDDNGAQSALDLISSLYDMPDGRRLKCIAQYRLAKNVSEGVIVELGTYQGNGAIALCLGSRDGHGVHVHTVDDYCEKRGWANEPYGPKDFKVYLEKIEAANVRPILHITTFLTLAKEWSCPVGLLFWDGGRYEMRDEVMVWERHIIPGGVLAVRDIADERFGVGDGRPRTT